MSRDAWLVIGAVLIVAGAAMLVGLLRPPGGGRGESE